MKPPTGEWMVANVSPNFRISALYAYNSPHFGMCFFLRSSRLFYPQYTLTIPPSSPCSLILIGLVPIIPSSFHANFHQLQGRNKNRRSSSFAARVRDTPIQLAQARAPGAEVLLFDGISRALESWLREIIPKWPTIQVSEWDESL